MLAPLDSQVIFKKAFTDPFVFTSFVNDVCGIEFKVNKIETGKKFYPKVGNIDFAFDIFAESADHRTIIELQKVRYDNNFDRFLYYHMMSITELQRSSKQYKINQEVYSVIVLTAPFKMEDKTGRPVEDDVLISSVDPINLQGKVVPIYGHKLIFLNPRYRTKKTPKNYCNWLDLISESILNPEEYEVNLDHPGIKKVVDIIDFENLTPEEIREMKEQTEEEVTLKRFQNEMDQERERANKEQERANKEEKEKQAALKENQKLREALKKAGLDPDQT